VSTKINDMLSKTSSSGALEAFDRMEDKIEKMEAEAEVPPPRRSRRATARLCQKSFWRVRVEGGGGGGVDCV
jgi:phage shock protein A